MKLYMFPTVRLPSIIRSLFTVHSAMVYVIQVCRQFSSRKRMELLESCLQTCMTYTIAECTVNKLLMMDSRTAETWRVSWQNKFVKLVHLFGFITKEKTPTDVSLVISARCIFTFVQLTLVNCFSKIFRVYCVISWGLSRCLTCKSEQVVTTARNWI